MDCAAGCGNRVRRSGARCGECARALHAARQRVRRGKPALPPLPPDTTEAVIAALKSAGNAVDRFEQERQKAEIDRGLDAMPYTEVDLWLRAIRAELTGARQLTGDWQVRARDIRSNIRTPND